MTVTPAYSRSPYTTHILAILLFTFFPLLFIVHRSWFPVRFLCILAGWFPILFTNPFIQAVLPFLRPALLPIFVKKVLFLSDRASSLLCDYFSIKICSFTCHQDCCHHPQEAESDERPLLAQPEPMSVIIQHFIDNDKLTDECWNSEMRQVELWENERYSGPVLPPLVADVSHSSSPDAMRKGWGKQHLRSGERGPWTRSRDGSNDVSADGAGGVEASGEVRSVSFSSRRSVMADQPIPFSYSPSVFIYSSNLTFSLTPGWFFVESEGWRKDLQPTWPGCGCDQGMLSLAFAPIDGDWFRWLGVHKRYVARSSLRSLYVWRRECHTTAEMA